MHGNMLQERSLLHVVQRSQARCITFTMQTHTEKCYHHLQLKKIVDTITSGSLKSLVGLDIEDVMKGHTNFKRLLQIAEILCLRLQKSRSETEAIKNAIKDTQVFTDTLSTAHTREHAEHIFGCISCGYISLQDNETSDKPKSMNKKSKKKR